MSENLESNLWCPQFFKKTNKKIPILSIFFLGNTQESHFLSVFLKSSGHHNLLSRLTGPMIFLKIHIGTYLFSQLSPMCPNIRFTTSSHVTQLTYVKVLIFFHTNASSEP